MLTIHANRYHAARHPRENGFHYALTMMARLTSIALRRGRFGKKADKSESDEDERMSSGALPSRKWNYAAKRLPLGSRLKRAQVGGGVDEVLERHPAGRLGYGGSADTAKPAAKNIFAMDHGKAQLNKQIIPNDGYVNAKNVGIFGTAIFTSDCT